MSKLGMNKALWAIYTSEESTIQATQSPEEFVRRFDLTELESSAIRSLDYATLLKSGAHPFLMFKSLLRTRGPLDPHKLKSYLDEIRDLPLRDIVT